MITTVDASRSRSPATDRGDPDQAVRHRADYRIHPRRYGGTATITRRDQRSAAAESASISSRSNRTRRPQDRSRRHRRPERRPDVRPRHRRQARRRTSPRQGHRRHGTMNDAGGVGPIAGIPRSVGAKATARSLSWCRPSNCDEAVDNAVSGCRCSRWPRSTRTSPRSRDVPRGRSAHPVLTVVNRVWTHNVVLGA